MKCRYAYAALAAVLGLALLGCQSAQPLPLRVAQAEPPAATLPAWTNSKGDRGGAGREVKILTKVFEIPRLERNDLPEKPYRKTLTREELDAYLRNTSGRKGVDLMTAPSVTTREGKSAVVQVGRELLVPGVQRETRREFIGFSNYVRARPARRAKRIRLDVLAEVRNLEGFSENDPQEPVFSVRRAEGSAELARGESILIGGVIRREDQDVEDIVPVLGDLPLIGRAFRRQSTVTFWTELIVVVTPTVIK